MGDMGMTARQGQIKKLQGNTYERYFQHYVQTKLYDYLL
jgi:hypothetical protein